VGVPAQSLTVSVVPGLGLNSRMVIVPLPVPDGTGKTGGEADDADGAVGVIRLGPLQAVKNARRINAAVLSVTFCMVHSEWHANIV
jgi:hypothetical protein